MTKRLLPSFVAGVTLGLFALLIGGCSVGFTRDDGSPVVGFDVGQPDPDTIEAIGRVAGTAATGLFGPGAGPIVASITGILGALGVGGWAAERKSAKNQVDAERRVREEADKAYDEARERAKNGGAA